MSNVYGLIGGKLGHSYSEVIHKSIFKRLGIKGMYNMFEVQTEDIPYAVKGLSALGAKGVNVTIPYKSEIIKEIDELSKEAQAIGAVNTLSFDNGKVKGYNTDYYGFGDMLKKAGIPVRNENVLVLGTGGASKAVVQYLKDNMVHNIVYASRSPQKYHGNIACIGYDDIAKWKDRGIIINCTPCGMFPNSGECPVKKEDIERFDYAADLIYNPSKTLFLKYAEEIGMKSINGLYMLVSQAVKSEEIWQKTDIPYFVKDEIYDMLKDYIDEGKVL